MKVPAAALSFVSSIQSAIALALSSGISLTAIKSSSILLIVSGSMVIDILLEVGNMLFVFDSSTKTFVATNRSKESYVGSATLFSFYPTRVEVYTSAHIRSQIQSLVDRVIRTAPSNTGGSNPNTPPVIEPVAPPGLGDPNQEQNPNN